MNVAQATIGPAPQKQENEWTFLDKSTREYTHAIHLYPARMHPEIAKRLIRRYAGEDTVVFDPFMGSGGVLLEGILGGRNAIGIDVNPFAVLLSKVKTTPIRKDLKRTRSGIIRNSMEDYSAKRYRPDLFPDMDLDLWYGKDTANKLSVLKRRVFDVMDADVRNFFKICLALTIRKASYQRNGAWKIHRMSNAAEFAPDVFGMFDKVSRDNTAMMENLADAAPKGIAYPLFGDTRRLAESFGDVSGVLSEGKLNLVITSPPYGDHRTTVAYGQFARHASLWLDLPPDDVRSVDTVGLGGRRKKPKRDLDSDTLDETLEMVRKNDLKLAKSQKPHRAEEVYSFFHDLDACMGQIANVLLSGQSRCCFVVANRTVRRVSIPTSDITVELGRKWGFQLEKIIARSIPNKVMPLRNAPENIPNNTGNTMTRESVIIMKY